MSGYIKYFDNVGKYMSPMIENDSVLVKCNKICNSIRKSLKKNFHSMPVYGEKIHKN